MQYCYFALADNPKFDAQIPAASAPRPSQAARPARTQALTVKDLALHTDAVKTFIFAETAFTAVTAYQNQLVRVLTMDGYHYAILILYIVGLPILERDVYK